jgi:hypothetical protein
LQTARRQADEQPSRQLGRQAGRQAKMYEGTGISQAASQRQISKQVESRRLKQGSTCK